MTDKRCDSMYMELTTNCPLRCPQCYCSLSGGKNINPETAEYWLKEAGKMGVREVMLNGSTEEINARSRDGYRLAISALELLQKNKFHNTAINWVMHSNNADDFTNMLELAEKYDVKNLVLLEVKPDSENQLPTLPAKKTNDGCQIFRVLSPLSGNQCKNQSRPVHRE